MSKAARTLPNAVQSILFVCHGNIIRSTLAEAFFVRAFPAGTIQVTSAGIRAQPGRRSDGRAREAAASLGLSLDNHRARALTAEMISCADVIFLMDDLNEALLLSAYPAANSKIRYLGDWNRNGGSRVIIDPYTGSLEDVRQCAQEIRVCIDALTAELSEAGQRNPPGR